MKNQIKILIALTMLVMLLPNVSYCQLSGYTNKTHRELLNSPNATTRVDTIIFGHAVVTDSIIAAIQKLGSLSSCALYSTVQAAKTAAVAARVPLTIPANCSGGTMSFVAADSDLVMFNYQTITISANDTIPEGAKITLAGEGKISVSSGVTLTIAGNFEGGLARRFIGTGTVRFLGTALDVIRPEWWGAKNDSTTNSATAFQSAFNALSGNTNGIVELLPGARYLIGSTVRFPRAASTQNKIILRGNGAKIYTTANDTIFVLSSQTPGSGSHQRETSVISDLRIEQLGTQGTGVGIAIYNAGRQLIENVYFEDFNNGLALINDAEGWSEHNRFYNLTFVDNDTGLIFNAKSTGTSSFRNSFFSSLAFPSMKSSAVVKAGGQAVGIAMIGTGTGGAPNIYQSTWLNVSMALNDSTTGFFSDGRWNNIFAQISFENFGGDGIRSRAFHFGTNATNIQGWIYADFATRGDLDKAIYNESGVAPQHIYTQIVGQSNNQAHGNSMIWDNSHQMFMNSVISNNAIGSFRPTVGDSQVVFQTILTSDGIPRFRYSHTTPLEFRRIFPSGDTIRLAPIRAHNIGQVRFPNDSTTLDVRNATFLQFGSNSSTIDSLKQFKGGIVGQTLLITFDDDSTVLSHLNGSVGSGRFNLLNSAATRTRAGMKSYFICQGESGGTFWREMFRHYKDGEDMALNVGDTVGVVLSAPGAATIHQLGHNVILDTFGAAAADTAVTLTGRIGDIIYISSRNSNRDITFLDAGNFSLGAERVLSNVSDVLILKATTTTAWKEVGWNDNN